ncbi:MULTISPECIES: DUF4145 domain-containing protein [Pseudomonas]|uniref:DUF4145 domain-containing protein n=1 Tax=Pseudomonas quercus TaxID=2722792 RepID=A0ABX0YGK3_9PSED|nr:MULTISPECIES: DUF4145 domain-containing protein [Pseudomonas]MBF7143871.1 DUF4145 domain-containing protein [Pseudomonas sp. LY10J]NJP02050.1 DUF4145 domain-containing protein [Pseudomonas quercus]
MSKYVAPAFNKTAFNCPRCEAYAKFDWAAPSCYFGNSYQSLPIRVSRCSHCGMDSYWHLPDDAEERAYMIIPNATLAPMPHPEAPEDIKSDYMEAREIAVRSPRGSAALLRLCIQKLCIELGEKGKNINDDIGSLVAKGLPIQIQQALDVVRVIGNNAVHPGKIASEDVAEICQTLFTLFNAVVEDRIARPKALDALYKGLPEGILEGIAKRDNKADLPD